MYRRENGTSLTLAGPTENVGGDWAKVMPLHFDAALHPLDDDCDWFQDIDRSERAYARLLC
jgi:hypothetical protein